MLGRVRLLLLEHRRFVVPLLIYFTVSLGAMMALPGRKLTLHCAVHTSDYIPELCTS